MLQGRRGRAQLSLRNDPLPKPLTVLCPGHNEVTIDVRDNNLRLYVNDVLVWSERVTHEHVAPYKPRSDMISRTPWEVVTAGLRSVRDDG